ncbi:hypothetical protein UVI_02017690 [Ustilaginoidea virens]|nr:hypothetical protein UVI_02017690 [Ustilaginoidea virens]
MSPADVEPPILAELAEACGTSASAIDDIYECTPFQVSMMEEPQPDVYQFVVSLDSASGVEAARKTLEHVIARLAILRTRIAACQLGRMLQVVVAAGNGQLESTQLDVDEYLQQSRRAGGKQWLGQPLFRAAFIGNRLVATAHHAIMDYWSWFTLFNVDVAAAHRGRLPDRPAFKEFVARCHALDDAVAADFWRARFRGSPALFPEPDASRGCSGQVRRAAVRRVTFASLAGLEGVRAQIPHFIEAAWALTSSIYTGSESVVYGFILSGRSSSANGLRDTIGPTIVEAPIQVDLHRNMTVGQLVRDRALSLRQLQAHPSVHWSMKKIRALSPAARQAEAYRSLLNIVPELPPPSAPDDADVVTFERLVTSESLFPLHLILAVSDDGFTIDPRFDPGAISETRLNHVLSQFEHTLRLLVEAPSGAKLSSLELLSPYDRGCISAWSAARQAADKTADSNSTVDEAFRARARERPDDIAVEGGGDGTRTDYRTLDQLSELVAHQLRERGVSRGASVALVFERSLWAVVAILGILKAGGVCVPVDRGAGREEKAALCSRAKAKVALTSSAEHARCAGIAASVLPVSAGSAESAAVSAVAGAGDAGDPADVAYVLFADGSDPRGVVLGHGDLVSSLRAQAKALNWQRGCRMLHLAEYASRWSLCEVLGTLLSGGCICIPADADDQEAGLSLSRTVIEPCQPSRAILVSSHQLGDTLPSSLQSILCVGQARAKAPPAWRTPGRQVFRGWGVREAGLVSTAPETTARGEAGHAGGGRGGGAGAPLASCWTWIVNPHNVHELAPIGSMGELVVSGPSVAQGYWAEEAKTAAAAASSGCFIAPPRWASWFGASGPRRFLRTGYLARQSPEDGSLAVAGRRGNRVRVRGRTVQLERLEEVLLGCERVRDAAVVTQISGGRTQLVAVVCLADARLPSQGVLRRLDEGLAADAAAAAAIAEEHTVAVERYARAAMHGDEVPDVWVAVEALPWVDGQELDGARIRQWLRGRGS